MNSLDKLKQAFTAAGEEMIDGDAGTDKTLEFASIAHAMMLPLLEVVDRLEVLAEDEPNWRDKEEAQALLRKLKGEPEPVAGRMTAIDNLQAALDKLPKDHELLVQHELDNEPSYLVWDHDRDAELVCVQEGNHDLARFLALAHNVMPALLEAACSLDIVINRGGLSPYGKDKVKEALNRLFGDGGNNGNTN